MKIGMAWRAVVVMVAAMPAFAQRETTLPKDGGALVQTMQAARIHSFGDEGVVVLEDVARPTPAPGEVLIRVRAAGVNPVDWKIREGMLKGRVALPFTLGQDVSGVVEEVGDGVTKWKKGDEVMAYLSLSKGGGYAQYAVAPQDDAAPKPARIDHVHAAGVPLAALTAWQALVEKADVGEGKTVLIHGGSGGVGHFAIQIARSRGAKVIATASAANLEFMRELGADEVIDYKAERFEDRVKDVDIVLDTVGGETQKRSYGVMKPGGYLVSIVQPPDPKMLEQHGVRGTVILVRPEGDQLTTIAGMIDEGKIVPHIGATIELADVRDAMERSKRGGHRGKIVLLVP